MDNRPIGFFDSGLGGLTCIPHVMKSLPNERIMYFGDTARTPYGSKAVYTIKNFSFQISDFLAQNNVKMIVIACNTVSATCLEALRERHPEIPILGIISPASKTVAAECNEENKIGIIGTKATIESEAYRKKIYKYNPSLDICETACPAFVPLIEEGIIQNEIMDLTIKYYLDQFISYNNIDTLVLGCTHYPLIKRNISRIYPDIKIINPSAEMFNSINETLEKMDLFAETPEHENIFYASDLSDNFISMIDRIFSDTGYTVAFKNFDIEASN